MTEVAYSNLRAAIGVNDFFGLQKIVRLLLDANDR